jgi:hypothetical protein
MMVFMKIKLHLKDEKLNKDPGIKQWLKTCEKIINKELKDKHLELTSIDYISPKEIYFTTSTLKPII